MIEFYFDSRGLNPLFNRGVERAIARTVSMSGSKAIRGLKVNTNRLVREKRKMKVAVVNKALPLDFPAEKTNLDGMVWTMRVSGKAMPVTAFPHRWTRSMPGTSFSLKASGPRIMLKAAFKVTLKSGHVGIFRRRGYGGGFLQVKRLPIDQLFGPRVSDVVNDRGFVQQVSMGAQTIFGIEFERLWPIELAKVR